jgi:hypothetical protein
MDRDPQRADGRTDAGHAGVLESWTQWLEGFEEWGWELEDIRDCGDRVLATVREKVLRYQEFYEETAALEAAGLSE